MLTLILFNPEQRFYFSYHKKKETEINTGVSVNSMHYYEDPIINRKNITEHSNMKKSS